MPITVCFHYNTDSWDDVTSVNFNSKKVHENKIFGRQDILHFSRRSIPRLQTCKDKHFNLSSFIIIIIIKAHIALITHRSKRFTLV